MPQVGARLRSESAVPASSGRYARIERLIAEQQCVLLDGATGSELISPRGKRPETEEHLWGFTEILTAPEAVLDVHRGYVEAGCDVLSTNTWGLPTGLLRDVIPELAANQPVNWMDVAREGIRLAREAVAISDRPEDVAVGFSLNEDLATPDGGETVRRIARMLEHDPPDFVLLETLSLVRPCTFETIDALIATGLPLWLSFRRCRHGVCGVYGEHWGGPEGDAFGREVRRFEEMGVGAILINCIPPDHVTGMVPWLRDFTDLPLGVYPNLGYLSSTGWRHEHEIDAGEYAELALEWRAEGAQIIGGCCGVGPEHIAQANAVLRDTVPGTHHPRLSEGRSILGRFSRSAAWTDKQAREVFPLPFPELAVEPEVVPPTPVSFMVWKYLLRERAGANRRCLDVGSGTGLLAVQLARNGAAHVHAIDVDGVAVANTLTNAFRNGVSDRVTAEVEDLYPWVPEEKYDVIVASLDQTPVDPVERVASHRPLDYWGRNLVDHLIRLLPAALADDGVAYVVHLSIIGQKRTEQQLAALGLQARVVDYVLMNFDPPFDMQFEQISRVESQSDAYHLHLGGNDAIVAYLLEITRADAASERSAAEGELAGPRRLQSR